MTVNPPHADGERYPYAVHGSDIALALAFGVYMTAVVLPLLLLFVLADRERSPLARLARHSWGTSAGTMAGMAIGLLALLFGGVLAHGGIVISLGVIVVATLAGAALGCLVEKETRRHRG
jgi:hypothetical protein